MIKIIHIINNAIIAGISKISAIIFLLVQVFASDGDVILLYKFFKKGAQKIHAAKTVIISLKSIKYTNEK